MLVLKHNFPTLLTYQLQHMYYLLPVFLLVQVEYSSSGEEESLLSSSMSSGRSVSSLCSCGKSPHGNESLWLHSKQVKK